MKTAADKVGFLTKVKQLSKGAAGYCKLLHAQEKYLATAYGCMHSSICCTVSRRSLSDMIRDASKQISVIMTLNLGPPPPLPPPLSIMAKAADSHTWTWRQWQIYM